MSTKYKVFKVSASGKLLEDVPELEVKNSLEKNSLLLTIFSHYKWGNTYIHSFIQKESIRNGKSGIEITYCGVPWWFAQKIENV